MARLESQAKKGYYKTPPHLVSLIAQYLKKEEGERSYRLLDPCCGEGEALALLGKYLRLPDYCLYGNELDEARYEKARQVIPNCLYGDAIFDMKASPCSFSLLYENPPYDYEGEISFKRTEMKFLEAHYRFLTHNGILIFIVPEPILHRPEFVKAMPVWFKDIRIFRFPPEDYTAFKQVVLFGRKKRRMSKKEERNYLAQLAHPKNLGDPSITYELPNVSSKISFSSRNICSVQIQEILKREQKIIKDVLNLGLERKTERKIKSLMPLRAGHQALLLASGIMDGIYQDPETKDILVIRGTVEQEVTETITKEEDETIEKIIRRPVAKVIALNLTQTKKLNELCLLEFK